MRLTPALALLAFLFGGSPPDKAYLTELRLSVEGRRVSVGFELVNAFDAELVERIETGLPSGFDFQFKLVKDYKKWWDRDIDSTTIQVFASYDAVSREYLVNYRQDGKLIESRVVDDLDSLGEAMTTFDRLYLFTIEEPPARRRLLVRARAALGRKNLFGIIPTRVETDSVESRKFRIAPEEG